MNSSEQLSQELLKELKAMQSVGIVVNDSVITAASNTELLQEYVNTESTKLELRTCLSISELADLFVLLYK